MKRLKKKKRFTVAGEQIDRKIPDPRNAKNIVNQLQERKIQN